MTQSRPYTGPEEVAVPAAKVQGPFITSTSSDRTTASATVTTGNTPAASPAPMQPASGTTETVRVSLSEKELDEAQEWNQARMERKWANEQKRVGEEWHRVVGDRLDEPMRLNAIRFLGIHQTRPGFLSSVVAQHLPDLPAASYSGAPKAEAQSPSSAPQTLRTVLQSARDLTSTLSAFDMFTSVEPSIEATPGVLSEEGDVDLVVRVRERSKYMLRTATDVGNGEGSANGTARIRNAFGGGENIEGNMTFGTRTKSAFQLQLDAPVNASPTTRAAVSLFSAQRDLNYYASCQESTKGLQAKINTLSPYGAHEFAYDAVLRQIGDLAPSASISVREAAGQSVKSAVSHTFQRDTRDDPFVPSRGAFTRLRQELAGFGGDARFLKSETESSASREVLPGWVLSAGLRTGVLFPFGDRPSLFADRFQLGGPTSVRLFRPNSMGPRDNGDFLGGDLSWSAGLSLVTPLPFKPDWPVKSHVFANAGRLGAWTETGEGATGGVSGALKKMATEPSVTVGWGLMYRHSLVRVEANVGVPVAAGGQEGAVKGLQFGLGFSFL